MTSKLWPTIAIFVLTTAALSGCFGGGGDGDTNVGDLDETATYDSAIADNGFRVTGNLTGAGTPLTGGSDGSAASLKAVDLAPDDSAGALDKADFLVDAKESDGSRLQAELRSIVSAADVGAPGDFFGGVAHNLEINGETGIGYPLLTTVKAYILLTGLARVRQNNETLDQTQLVQVAVTKGIRGADGAALAENDTNDLEVHVLFPGSLVPGNPAFPNSTDGFVYYYFENVKLEQLTPDAKAEVGSKLTPPELPNVAPVANAVVTLNGTQVGEANITGDFLNVTLDASNSTDPDGRIEAYSWDVKELNATGALVPLNRTSGVTANFSFTSAGLKVIELRIIDNDGGIANATIFFYVNYVRTLSHNFGAQTGTSAGAFTSCQPAVNCQQHSVTVYFGAQQMVVTMPARTGGTVCDGPNVDVLDPSGTEIASDDATITIGAEELAAVGKYSLQAWFDRQVQCAYSFTASVQYSPVAAA